MSNRMFKCTSELKLTPREPSRGRGGSPARRLPRQLLRGRCRSPFRPGVHPLTSSASPAPALPPGARKEPPPRVEQVAGAVAERAGQAGGGGAGGGGAGDGGARNGGARCGGAVGYIRGTDAAAQVVAAEVVAAPPGGRSGAGVVHGQIGGRVQVVIFGADARSHL